MRKKELLLKPSTRYDQQREELLLHGTQAEGLRCSFRQNLLECGCVFVWILLLQFSLSLPFLPSPLPPIPYPSTPHLPSPSLPSPPLPSPPTPPLPFPPLPSPPLPSPPLDLSLQSNAAQEKLSEELNVLRQQVANLMKEEEEHKKVAKALEDKVCACVFVCLYLCLCRYRMAWVGAV